MFNLDSMRALLAAKPFVPFRLILSDGGSVEVRTPEVVLVARQFVVVGLLDPTATDTLIERWTTVYYLHITRIEQLTPGAPPFQSPPASPGTPAPTPA